MSTATATAPRAVMCLRMRPADGRPLGAEAYAGVLALLEGLTPAVQALPPDGALADVGAALRYFGCDAVRLAAVVRVRSLALYGVDCTVGVAGNPMLARAAVREARPSGTLVIPDEPAAAVGFLAGKPVTVLEGIGPKAARTLCSYGLDSVGRVAAAPPAALRRILGARLGREVGERALGIDRTPVRPGAAARAVAGERAFDRDELDPVRHRRALLSLTQELGAKLRTREEGGGQVCRSLSLTVRCADRSTLTRTRTLAEPTAHTDALTATAYALYASLGLQRARVRALSLRAEDLIPAERAARQLTFDPRDEKARRLEAVTDRVRARFGPHVIARGTLAA